MSSNDKLHYHLITGEIIFTPKDSNEVSSVNINGILADAQKDLPVRLLNRSQQILQINFFNQMKDVAVNVVNVVLHGFTYLGEFTKEEFHKEPEGMVRKEVSQTPDPTPSSNNNGEAKGTIKLVPRVSLEEAMAGKTGAE